MVRVAPVVRVLRQRAILVVGARNGVDVAHSGVGCGGGLRDADIENAVRRQLAGASGVVVRQPAVPGLEQDLVGERVRPQRLRQVVREVDIGRRGLG